MAGAKAVKSPELPVALHRAGVVAEGVVPAAPMVSRRSCPTVALGMVGLEVMDLTVTVGLMGTRRFSQPIPTIPSGTTSRSVATEPTASAAAVAAMAAAAVVEPVAAALGRLVSVEPVAVGEEAVVAAQEVPRGTDSYTS